MTTFNSSTPEHNNNTEDVNGPHCDVGLSQCAYSSYHTRKLLLASKITNGGNTTCSTCTASIDRICAKAQIHTCDYNNFCPMDELYS